MDYSIGTVEGAIYLPWSANIGNDVLDIERIRECRGDELVVDDNDVRAARDKLIDQNPPDVAQTPSNDVSSPAQPRSPSPKRSSLARPYAHPSNVIIW
jgi:hypothetical protein